MMDVGIWSAIDRTAEHSGRSSEIIVLRSERHTQVTARSPNCQLAQQHMRFVAFTESLTLTLTVLERKLCSGIRTAAKRVCSLQQQSSFTAGWRFGAFSVTHRPSVRARNFARRPQRFGWQAWHFWHFQSRRSAKVPWPTVFQGGHSLATFQGSGLAGHGRVRPGVTGTSMAGLAAARSGEVRSGGAEHGVGVRRRQGRLGGGRCSELQRRQCILGTQEQLVTSPNLVTPGL